MRMPSIRPHAGLDVSLYWVHSSRYYQRDRRSQIRHAAGHQPFLESMDAFILRWNHFDFSDIQC